MNFNPDLLANINFQSRLEKLPAYYLNNVFSPLGYSFHFFSISHLPSQVLLQLLLLFLFYHNLSFCNSSTTTSLSTILLLFKMKISSILFLSIAAFSASSFAAPIGAGTGNALTQLENGQVVELITDNDHDKRELPPLIENTSCQVKIPTEGACSQFPNGQVISEKFDKRDLEGACTQRPNGQVISERVEKRNTEGACSQLPNGQVISKIDKRDLEEACTQRPNGQVVSERIEKRDLEGVCTQLPNGQVISSPEKRDIEDACTQRPNGQVISEKVEKRDLDGDIVKQRPNGQVYVNGN